MRPTIGLFALFLFAAPGFTPPCLASESKGQKLFVDNCVRCHGVNAKGSLAQAKALKVDPVKLDLTRESVVQKAVPYLRQRITDGHGKMPQQGRKLSPAEIKSLVDYIQSLQKAYVLKVKKVK